MIPVTKSFLPPIEEYTAQVQRAYNNQWLTNRGELVKELEEKLKNFLGLYHIIITNNGTIPIQIALKILGNYGEIITTPFSYVATTSSIVWENCTPVFVDIDPEHLTINENLIEAAITKKTTCILATHVFGNPCNIEAIQKIAQKHNLKVIYDAAHCFGVQYKGKSIFEYGDVSTCSFHATKLFHTGEGGAYIVKDKVLQSRMFFAHNFGHNGPTVFNGVGINAKISELQAAMGLAVFPHLEEIFSKRKAITEYYNSNLSFETFQTMKIRKDTEWNASYYPIIFKSEAQLLKVEKALNDSDIFPRRYFYPSLNTLEYVAYQKMEVSESIASRILCLPLYPNLELEIVDKIVGIVNGV